MMGDIDIVTPAPEAPTQAPPQSGGMTDVLAGLEKARLELVDTIPQDELRLPEDPEAAAQQVLADAEEAAAAVEAPSQGEYVKQMENLGFEAWEIPHLQDEAEKSLLRPMGDVEFEKSKQAGIAALKMMWGSEYDSNIAAANVVLRSFPSKFQPVIKALKLTGFFNRAPVIVRLADLGRKR